MICSNRVKIYPPWPGRDYDVKCGETGARGELALCEECEKKYNVQHPQGWRNVPGDICRHGNYVGDEYGPDYLCGQCEDGK